ncbi:class I SAM-dependent methyltransferase [Bacillus solitudinis]|uniref:class I SAM-dependent methyltransferase n=1 Tax=Bacillus solitudinis TaxID=2014074 RepID=UPI000C244298|nr:class I SAM-dependent methyltransferase [Bacillus solitudinis]
MLGEWRETIKARKWLKKNIPFLYSWHAYVGNELKLFKAFKHPKTVDEVANNLSVPKDLLKSWVDVGVAINHLKKKSSESFQVRKLQLLPKRGSLSGALLKEMMELHIPSLLSYPDLMKTNTKRHFDHQKHGDVVARTSRLIETIAYPIYKKLIKEGEISSIVDVGCGHAGYLQKVAEEQPNIEMVGIDNHPLVVQRATEACGSFSNIKIIHADLHEWAPTNQKNDLVMLNNIMHYIDLDKRESLLSRVSKWTHKKGKIIIITPVRNAQYGKEFSATFNSFFSAHSNLHPLPNQTELETIAANIGMKISQFNPLIKTGSWYIAVFEHKKV